MTNRIAEVLCPEHRGAAVDCWPFGHDVDDLGASCRRCADAYDRVRAEDGRVYLQALPHLDAATYFSLCAIHEAAHAIIGADVGHIVTEIRVNGRGAADIGGGVRTEDFELPVHDHLAMIWAGQLAMARQIKAVGAAPEDLIDCCWLAENDTNEARRWIAEFSLPVGAGRRLADKLIDIHWSHITALAVLLQHQPVLEGVDLRHALGMAA
jgi:hypothetical protein